MTKALTCFLGEYRPLVAAELRLLRLMGVGRRHASVRMHRRSQAVPPRESTRERLKSLRRKVGQN